ncbi:MAG: COX15/CtaA family protein, partial [Pseudomonadota bacterium]
KVIYYWEWGHRLVARTIGLVFVLPFAVFWWRGMLPRWFKPWGVALLALGGLQGFVGWWMVTSGLTERVDVSQYRLAVHLTLACIILGLTIWLSERLAGRRGIVGAPASVQISAILLPFAVLAQIALGALVAGIDAGLASDTWPLMLGSLVPDGLGVLSPAWINAFENPIAVQFNHRLFGYAVLVLALFHAAVAWRGGPNAGRRLALLLAAMVTFQALTGIAVVIHHVPPVLAGTHQVMAALTLWVTVVQATRLTRVRAPAAAVRSLHAGAEAGAGTLRSNAVQHH